MPPHNRVHVYHQQRLSLVLFLAFLCPAFLVQAQADDDACPVLRPGPPLYPSPPAPFATDFTNKTQALTFLSENTGRVTTEGVLACRRTDHLLYNMLLGGFGLATDVRGLRIVQDNIGGSVCDRNSQIATGHLLTRFYLQEGRIDLTARIGYGPAGPNYHSEDSFSCFGLYIHDTVSQNGYRNEVSMCVSSRDPTTVRMGVWNGSPADRQEARQVGVKKDLAQGFYTYSIEWGPHRVRFWLDDRVLWDMWGKGFCAGVKAKEVDAALRWVGGGERLPYEPMSVRIILRPLGVTYQGTSYMDVTHFGFSPLTSVVGGEEEEVEGNVFLVSSAAGRTGGLGGGWRWWWVSLVVGVCGWVGGACMCIL